MQSGTVPAIVDVETTAVPRRRRLWCRRLAATLCVIAILYAITPRLLGQAGRWLNVGEELDSPVDYVYVLGGEASTRPFLAAAIYRAGFAKAVLIPEGANSSENTNSLAEHQIQKAVLLSRQVPMDAIILLPGPVESTRDEAAALAVFLADHSQSSVAVVTSDFHTRRTRLLFRRRLPAHRDQIRFVACPTDDFASDDWWHFRDGILQYVSEYAKLVRDTVH